MTFQQLLQLGQKFEDKMINYMMNRYDRLELVDRPTGNWKYYDFIMSNGLKYECKYDAMSGKTGNIFIEYEQTGKPSGIVTTTADVYIIGTPDSTYFIDVDRLRRLILQQKQAKRYISKQKCGFMFKIEIIEQNAFVVAETNGPAK